MTEQPTLSPLDALLGASVQAAVKMLSDDGEFYPFALAVTTAGEIVRPTVDAGSEHPSAEHVAGLLLTALRATRETLAAASICSDVTIDMQTGERRDAVRIELEAPEADPLVVLVPYADAVLDEPFAMPGERRVFG